MNMVSLYDLFMRPLEQRGIRKARRELIKKACGKVLEIGAGTGANVAHYNADCVTDVTVTDKVVNKHLANKHAQLITVLEADAIDLPFDDDSFDTVVHTLVFCSIPDVDKGLQEIKRVLKPGGKLVFIEHVLPQKQGWRRLFRGINPVWRLFSHGCSLTKDFHKSLLDNGFDLEENGRFMNTVFFYGVASVTPI